MGAIKPLDHTEQELLSSLLSRGTAHPIRCRILNHLLQGPCTNIDLARRYQLDKSTIKEHLDKLHDAELITAKYVQHHYLISLNPKHLGKLAPLLGWTTG